MPLRQISRMTEEEKSILRTLLYFDIFHYPLTESEIVSFSPRLFESNWLPMLIALTDRKIIFRLGDFYSLHNDTSLEIRRKAGNKLAEKKIKTARLYSRLISSFPFVRAVMLSGSISKGYMDEKSDIDYFIITAKRRLWIVRGATAVFRRIFLFNSHKYFCTNYFVDNESLEIEEKNLFTAIEAATLMPMFGKDFVCQFQSANEWRHKYLPNHQPENGLGKENGSFLKRVVENIIPSNLLDRLDQWLMKRFTGHWRATYRHMLNDHDFSIAFQSGAHVSRSHPEFYQKKVLSLYEEKIHTFEHQHGISLEI
jgi:hypothetical protein